MQPFSNLMRFPTNLNSLSLPLLAISVSHSPFCFLYVAMAVACLQKNLSVLLKDLDYVYFLVISMASNRGQGGIQQLLAAEQEAQRIVNAAKNEKLARLKQAKEEAEKEIAEYRAQLEYEFQKKSSGDSGANVKRLEQETDAKIHHLKTEAGRISVDVVTMLLKWEVVLFRVKLSVKK
ncbi:V-type proton ATPase subunit G, partial [Mucuna pruriens]